MSVEALLFSSGLFFMLVAVTIYFIRKIIYWHYGKNIVPSCYYVDKYGHKIKVIKVDGDEVWACTNERYYTIDVITFSKNFERCAQ